MEIEKVDILVADNDNFTAHVEMLNGDPFLHIDIHKTSKESFKQMGVLFDKVVDKCVENDIPVLSFYGSEASVKLAERFAPLDHLEEIEGGYVGCWYL